MADAVRPLPSSDAEALYLRGAELHRAGRLDESAEALDRAVRLAPGNPHYRISLAATLGRLGRHHEAIGQLVAALTLRGDIPELHNNLGVSLEKLGRCDEAAAAYRNALRLNPDYPEAHHNLGHVLRKLGRAAEAAECHRRAIALRPEFAGAHAGLGAVLGEQGDQPGAVACFRRAVELDGADPIAHSALLYTMHYDPASTPGMLLEEAKRWAERHARFEVVPHETDRNLTAEGLRRAQSSRGRATFLRVGYLSPDFRDHTVPRLIEPVLRHHDRSKVEVFCYSAVRSPDRVTERLRDLATGWRDISRLSDHEAAELIRSDRIDILVDLAGHWAENRMTLFARKPAPVQVQIGYPGTTGLEAMDYRITDAWSDPPGESDGHYVERLVRLPRCAWCYEPDGEVSGLRPEAGRNACPTKSAGHVTFGCLNNPVKVTDPCLQLWGRILEGVPGSRLLLLSAEGREDKALVDRLKRAEIDPDRVEPVRRQPRDKYLELFNQIDIALDPFPYNGETTTCDGLWMAVPHVALAGDRCASRRTMSHLCNLGLGELVASSGDEYIRIATTLAGDLPHLAELRASMRQRMSCSPIMDYAGYTADLEAAYRQMWRAWWGTG